MKHILLIVCMFIGANAYAHSDRIEVELDQAQSGGETLTEEAKKEAEKASGKKVKASQKKDK